MDKKIIGKCKTVAFAIVCVADSHGELEWLTDNSFILDGSYEKIARIMFDELNVDIIEQIDGLIEAGIMVVGR